jgi:hypothetical protein
MAASIQREDEPMVRRCGERHRWRVVGFSVRERTLTERCTACGRERVRGW